MADSRPLSPHLSIWKWRVHMAVSIFHRVSGNAMAFAGLTLFAWWLAAAATSRTAYESFAMVAGSPFGWLVWVGLSWLFFQHMMSGVRHLAMDSGWGLGIGVSKMTATSVFVCAILLRRFLSVRAAFHLDGGTLMASDFKSASGLKRVRGLGSAKSGAHHWWLQRVTAAGNLLLLVWFIASVLTLPNLGHSSVLAWVGQPLVAVPLLLLILSTFWHARLGVQVMIEDYVHAEGLKLLALLALNFFIVGTGAVAAFSVLAIAFGA
jgi:succinate dehydrogenase / fumarate reductase membrane anchor subunit